jgi:hypothetical protein
MDAIATDGGWDLEGGGELYSDRRKQRSLGSIKQNEAARIYQRDSLPFIYSHDAWENIVRSAWCRNPTHNPHH